MKYFGAAILGTLALILAPVTQATQTWTEGSQYDVITPAQRTNVPAGKVEVMEVFSYGCPSCNGFQPVMSVSPIRTLPAIGLSSPTIDFSSVS